MLKKATIKVKKSNKNVEKTRCAKIYCECKLICGPGQNLRRRRVWPRGLEFDQTRTTASPSVGEHTPIWVKAGIDWKSTKIFYSSKSTVTLMNLHLSTNKVTNIKIESNKKQKVSFLGSGPSCPSFTALQFPGRDLHFISF